MRTHWPCLDVQRSEPPLLLKEGAELVDLPQCHRYEHACLHYREAHDSGVCVFISCKRQAARMGRGTYRIPTHRYSLSRDARSRDHMYFCSSSTDATASASWVISVSRGVMCSAEWCEKSGMSLEKELLNKRQTRTNLA